MDVASRIKRMREFLAFFIEKVQHPDEYEGKCYWCEKAIDPKAFYCGLDTESLTIHHKDEDRSNNNIDNLVIMHRACHTQMHKAADKINLPALYVREMLVKERRKAALLGPLVQTDTATNVLTPIAVKT